MTLARPIVLPGANVRHGFLILELIPPPIEAPTGKANSVRLGEEQVGNAIPVRLRPAADFLHAPGIGRRKIVDDLMFFIEQHRVLVWGVACCKGWKRELGTEAPFRAERREHSRVESKHERKFLTGSAASRIVPKHIGLDLAMCCPGSTRHNGEDISDSGLIFWRWNASSWLRGNENSDIVNRVGVSKPTFQAEKFDKLRVTSF